MLDKCKLKGLSNRLFKLAFVKLQTNQAKIKMAGEEYKNRWKTDEGIKKREQVLKAILKGNDLTEILKGFPFTEEYKTRNDLRGLNLSSEKLNRADLSQCELRFSNFNDAKLSKVFFSDSDIRDSIFEGADLQDANFYNVLCKRVIFEGAGFQRATLEKTNFQEANFNKANLTGAIIASNNIFRETNFEEAIFDDYPDSDAKFTSLTGIDFQTTCLRGARLAQCDLRDANLNGVDLSKAKLSGAKLQGTILTGCNLEGTNLEKAEFDAKTNVSNVLFLNQDNFHSGGWKRKRINEDNLRSAKEGYRILKDYFKDQSKYDDTSWASFSEKRIERKLFWNDKKFIRWAISSLLNLLCGYGEKPYRVILSSFVWIFLFSIAYFFTGMPEMNSSTIVEQTVSSYFDSYLPYSIATFTNFQFAEIKASKGLFGYIALVEAFVGFFTLGLFIFTLTRRYATR